LAHLQNCEKRLSASSRLSVKPSIFNKQLSSHWTDFPEILFEDLLKIGQASFVKIGQA
jgi:hypothetical protein